MDLPDPVLEMRPTTKLVYIFLKGTDQSRLNQKDIAAQTGLTPRATRSALKDLIDKDLVIEQPHLEDLREKRYQACVPGE